MFIPLHDSNSLDHIDRQYVTIGLIVVNVAIWLVTALVPSESFAEASAMGLGFIPALIFDQARLHPDLVIVDEGWTFITYAFLHGDAMHLGFNMLFLWVFGDNVEDAMGHVRFLVFYLACAAAGAAVHALVMPTSDGPLIGASGAVSGVVAAYVLLHPKVRVWVLVLWRIPLPMPAALPLAFWIGQQFYFLVADTEGRVSFAAHVGGILAGAILVVILKRRTVALFDRVIVSPKAVHHVESQIGGHVVPADAGKPDPAAPPVTPNQWGRPPS